MDRFQVKSGSEELMEPRWTRVVMLSLFLHLLVFSVILFMPDSIPTRRISGATIYEVNLVEMPTAGRSRAQKGVGKKRVGKIIPNSKKSSSTKRISRPQKEPKPVVIGKRVVERKKKDRKKVQKAPKPKVAPSALIDRAVAKIERKIKAAEKEDHVLKAISAIEAGVKGTTGQGPARGGPESGITIRMYKMQVEEQVKSNWSYPVALINPRHLKDLHTIVVVKVKEDGEILKSWFKTRSSNAIFDGSVMKAIERSNPLPPFPEGYKKSYEEFEIRFDLSEWEDY